MRVYVLIKVGVYIQDVLGVYRTEKLAERMAKHFKKKEPDDYHSFDVMEFQLDFPKLEARKIIYEYGEKL